jgi:predicted dehydrogenase
MSEQKLRAGVIGLGVGGNHARGYLGSPYAELVALCDSNDARLQENAAKWTVQRRYTNYREMFRDAELDIVSVCLPNALHAEVTIEALKAGMHVVCEKPMALSVDEAERMIEAAKRYNRRLMVCYNWRYRPDSQWMKRVAASGRLGDIYHVHVAWRRETGIPGWGLFGSKAASGGGALIDLGVHVIDLGLWMLDWPTVTTITGDTRSLFGPHSYKTWGRTAGATFEGFDVEDGGTAYARLSTGATMNIHVTWAEHTMPQEDSMRIELHGTQGTAVQYIRNYSLNDSLRLYTEVEGEPVTITPSLRPGKGLSAHETLIQEIADCIAHDRPSPTTGEQGLAAIKVLEGLYKSAETKREVVLA